MGGKMGKLQFVSKPIVELNPAEYSLIKAVWTRIEFEPKLHGTGFYLRFFAKYPQYIKYFLADPMKDDVNPDALMTVKFTVIIEILGYLVLDFYNKPKRFNQLIGYIGMIHKDMNLDVDDINNFFTALIDYLRDAMSDLMTERCEAVFVEFFRNIRELMIKSMEEERGRFVELEDEDVVVPSNLKSLVPCSWSQRSNRLIYGQPKNYWISRQQKWKIKIKSWEEDLQLGPAITMNLQNAPVETTSSEDDALERFKARDDSDPEMRNSYPDEENHYDSFRMQRARYLNTGRLVSVPHFDRLIPESSDMSALNEREEFNLMNYAAERSAGNIKLSPRERHRAQVAALKSLQPRPSRRLISSTDTGSPRWSDGSSARERRRSTWN